MAATEHGTHQAGHDSVTDVATHQRTFEAFITSSSTSSAWRRWC